MVAKAPCDEASMRTFAAERPCRPDAARWVLAATILGSSMAFIDNTVVNVALPVLQKSLSASVSGVQWVVEAYTLFLAALILTGGALGDQFGRRRIFGIGVALFAVASTACGLAANIDQLIAARALQGVGGALLVPGSLAIIGSSFQAERRGQAIGTWSGFSSITTAIGPVIGGWLVQHISWRAAFFVNVPLAALTLVILFLYVPESRNETAPARIDVWGAALVTLGLAGVVYGLVQASNAGMGAPSVIIALAVGTGLLVAFVVLESRAREPMMPPTLFRSRTFSGANLLTLLLYAALSGAFFFLPFNLIQVQGYSPTAAGSAFLPFVVLLFVLSRWSGGLIDRFGPRLPLVLGPLVAALGFALLARPGIGGSYWSTFFPAIFALGLGMAITIAPLTTAVMGAVDAHRAGVASGINNAISRVAGLLAIAILGFLAVMAFGSALAGGLAQIPAAPAVKQALMAQQTRLAAAAIPLAADQPTQAALRRLVDEAYLHSFRLVALSCAGLAALSALAAYVLVDGAGMKRPPGGS